MLEVVGGRQAESDIKKIESLDSFPTVPSQIMYHTESTICLFVQLPRYTIITIDTEHGKLSRGDQ